MTRKLKELIPRAQFKVSYLTLTLASIRRTASQADRNPNPCPGPDPNPSLNPYSGEHPSGHRVVDRRLVAGELTLTLTLILTLTLTASQVSQYS